MKKISQKSILNNGFNEVIESLWDTETRNNQSILTLGQTGEKDAAGVLIYTRDHKLVVLSEFLFGIQDTILGFVAGRLQEGESIYQAAKRRTLQEAGYNKGTFLYLGKYIQGHFLQGWIHYFLCIGGEKGIHTNTDTMTQYSTKEVSNQEYESMLYENKIHCSYALGAYFLAKQKTSNFTNFNI